MIRQFAKFSLSPKLVVIRYIIMQIHTHIYMHVYTHVCTDDNKSLYHKQHKLSEIKFYDSLDLIQIQRKICGF